MLTTHHIWHHIWKAPRWQAHLWICGRLLASLAIVILPLSESNAQALADPGQLVEPGWGPWRPRADIAEANFDSGFSNLELGGYLDFEALCQQATGLPNDAISYWFRLDHLVQQIGTGNVEYGCWMDDRFAHTYRLTAIDAHDTDIACLRVNSDLGNGLVVRAEPRRESSRLGVISNGRTVKPSGFPASIVSADPQGRQWLAIETPISGWVSVNASPASHINLELCNP